MDKRIKRILMLILVAIVLILGAVYCFTLHPTGGSGFEIEKVTPEDNAAVFCILTEDGWYQSADGGGASNYKLHSCTITIKGRVIHSPYRLVLSDEDGTVVFDETFNEGTEIDYSKKLSFSGNSYVQTSYIKDYSFDADLEVTINYSSYGYEILQDEFGLNGK